MKKTAVKQTDQSRTYTQGTPYFFHEGTCTRAFEYLGAHREGDRFLFRVWAPNADDVSVTGDFTGWRTEQLPLSRVTEGGVWEISVDGARIREGDKYKFFIRNGCRELYKADPYAVAMERAPGTASVICTQEAYQWRDGGWLRFRRAHYKRETAARQPINIYELHAGSWRRHEDGRYFSYGELAAELVTYVKQMGYTHIELLPLSEHPYDGSWGYQVCGHYAPTARYGTPTELMAFVDTMHEAGIGVILDWVPAHFPKDAHGLFEFDGQPLYEYRDIGRMEHGGWGTRCFDLGRAEVQSFLLSNAAFWAEKYHIDGLRVDAVASMLYPDLESGAEGTLNTDAVVFLQKLNRAMVREFPDVMMIAEDSTAHGGVTSASGLGFTLKWNMGWMNDSLSYLREDPLFRKHHHRKLTFPITYAFDEQYVLPVSHDEVVHGKASLIERATGDRAQKLATVRAYMTYMMTHPGKKLLFMGCEFGQRREWDCNAALEWFLLDDPAHAALQLFCADLNHFYLSEPALWQRDGDAEGFEWIDPDDADCSIFTYRRRDARGGEVIVAINFTPVERREYLLGVPYDGIYEEIFSSDDIKYGGGGVKNSAPLQARPAILEGYDRAVSITLPGMSGTVFRCTHKKRK